MKKLRIIAVFLFTGIAFMEVGYGAWNNQLNIAATAVTSTGYLKVEFVDGYQGSKHYAPEAGVSNADYQKVDSTNPIQIIQKTIHNPAEYANASIDYWDSKKINVSFNNLYPGSLGLLTAKLQNNGSIPAKFDTAIVEFDDSNSVKLDNLKKSLLCAGGFIKWDNHGFKVTNTKGKEFHNVPLGNLATAMNSLLDGIVLNPGESISLDIPEDCVDIIEQNVEAYDPATQNCLLFYIPSTVSNEDNITDATGKFSIYIRFKQLY